jgi:hypothetical protein
VSMLNVLTDAEVGAVDWVVEGVDVLVDDEL